MTLPFAPSGIPIPHDFDEVLLSGVQSKAASKYEARQPELIRRLRVASMGLIYRFTACSEHDNAFTDSISKPGGDSPAMPERYIQEKNLFGFFSTGLSAIECLSFGLYAIGSIIDLTRFPAFTDRDVQNINPKSNAEKYGAAFTNDPLEIALNALIASTEYREWKKMRNVLVHQSHPGRSFSMFVTSTTSVQRDATKWAGFTIDSQLTRQRRTWLADKIKSILQETDAFLGRRT
jgi:hypothetical protein